MHNQISSQDRFSSVTRGWIKLKSKPASYFKVVKKRKEKSVCVWGEGGVDERERRVSMGCHNNSCAARSHSQHTRRIIIWR